MNMRKFLLSFAVLLITATSFAQNTVHANNASTRKTGSFHGVAASAGVEVILTKDNNETVVVTADNSDIVNHVKTEVVNGILKIYRESDWHFWNSYHGTIKVYVGYKQLDVLRASSGASITSDVLKINKLNAEVSSGGEIVLSGTSEDLKVEGSSGGSFKGYDFVTNTCNAEVSSGADIKLTIQKELFAKASSGGEIKFKGAAVIRDIQVSSGGEVKRAK